MSKGGVLTKKITDHLVRRFGTGVFVINVVKASKAGIADLIVCIDGQMYAFEVKSEGDKETDLQTHQLACMGLAGAYGGYVRSTDDVDNIIANKIKPVHNPNITRMSL